MTKRQDLYLQRRSRPEQSDHRQPNQAVNISHQPRASPDSTSLASRIEFPTMTAGIVLVEERASGISLIQELRAEGFSIVQAAPALDGDTNLRLRGQTAKIEGGFVLFP